MAVRTCAAAGPNPSESPESGANGPPPGTNQPPETCRDRRRGRPMPFALPPPLWKTSPHRPRNRPVTRRRPLPTPTFNPQPNPQRPYGPPLSSSGDRHALESVIGMLEQVIGIGGMGTRVAHAEDGDPGFCLLWFVTTTYGLNFIPCGRSQAPSGKERSQVVARPIQRLVRPSRARPHAGRGFASGRATRLGMLRGPPGVRKGRQGTSSGSGPGSVGSRYGQAAQRVAGPSAQGLGRAGACTGQLLYSRQVSEWARRRPGFRALRISTQFAGGRICP